MRGGGGGAEKSMLCGYIIDFSCKTSNQYQTCTAFRFDDAKSLLEKPFNKFPRKPQRTDQLEEDKIKHMKRDPRASKWAFDRNIYKATLVQYI